MPNIDYTPSIEEMRRYYSETWFYAPHTNSNEEKNAEFDRFLALMKSTERERIIKLLEEHNAKDWCGEGNCPSPFPTDHLIALIKGENK